MKLKGLIFLFLINFSFCFSSHLVLQDKYLELEPVQNAIQEYSSRANLKAISRSFNTGSEYIYFVKKIIKDKKMPEDLIYLALVESSFNIEATSRSGAKGLWQFMLNSIADHNIIHDQWLDERLDFWKSTQGAMDKLAYNYKVTQDWLLAIAAYNCGLGLMTRTMEQYKEKDFFKLLELGAIPEQTAKYVPKFLAFSYICQNPKSFEDFRITYPRVVWEKIKIEQSIDIRALANNSNLPLERLLLGNKELKTYFTPPNRDTYYLKVLKQDSKIIKNALIKYENTLFIENSTDNIKEKKKTLESTQEYIVQPGDNLWKIAQKLGFTIEEIADKNNFKTDEVLSVGTVIKIPRKS